MIITWTQVIKIKHILYKSIRHKRCTFKEKALHNCSALNTCTQKLEMLPYVYSSSVSLHKLLFAAIDSCQWQTHSAVATRTWWFNLATGWLDSVETYVCNWHCAWHTNIGTRYHILSEIYRFEWYQCVLARRCRRASGPSLRLMKQSYMDLSDTAKIQRARCNVSSTSRNIRPTIETNIE